MALAVVSEDSISPQRAANKLAPLGWCNTCIGEAKQALADAEPTIPPVQAAICTVPVPSVVEIPGAGRQTVVATVGICWAHCGAKKASALATS